MRLFIRPPLFLVQNQHLRNPRLLSFPSAILLAFNVLLRVLLCGPTKKAAFASASLLIQTYHHSPSCALCVVPSLCVQYIFRCPGRRPFFSKTVLFTCACTRLYPPNNARSLGNTAAQSNPNPPPTTLRVCNRSLPSLWFTKKSCARRAGFFMRATHKRGRVVGTDI
jgi:hypothetical protein